ncbi:hypothetical protein AAG570_009976 [Ranatra chinensis]|uniref:Secreted protein n=1 Tax=Ranatra chinensis TaxID=642074 RepID=A0ABD0YQN0_9HEMI
MGESTISLSRPATTCPVDWFLKMTIKLVWCVVWYLSVAVRCDIFDVKRSHVMRGRNGSLFGFSVAQHPHWYLIGAPLDVSVESTSELTGALWKCPTSRLSQGNCTRIDIEEVCYPLVARLDRHTAAAATERSQLPPTLYNKDR